MVNPESRETAAPIHILKIYAQSKYNFANATDRHNTIPCHDSVESGA